MGQAPVEKRRSSIRGRTIRVFGVLLMIRVGRWLVSRSNPVVRGRFASQKHELRPTRAAAAKRAAAAAAVKRTWEAIIDGKVLCCCLKDASRPRRTSPRVSTRSYVGQSARPTFAGERPGQERKKESKERAGLHWFRSMFFFFFVPCRRFPSSDCQATHKVWPTM